MQRGRIPSALAAGVRRAWGVAACLLRTADISLDACGGARAGAAAVARGCPSGCRMPRSAGAQARMLPADFRTAAAHDCNCDPLPNCHPEDFTARPDPPITGRLRTLPWPASLGDSHNRIPVADRCRARENHRFDPAIGHAGTLFARAVFPRNHPRPNPPPADPCPRRPRIVWPVLSPCGPDMTMCNGRHGITMGHDVAWRWPVLP